MGEVWSFGRIAAAIGSAVDRDAPALLHGDQVTCWDAFDRRTDALAAAFIAAGAAPGDKLAHLMRNSPAYLETTYAGFKARLVHVNVNYRYTGEELWYILDNSDAAVVVYDAEFAPLVGAIEARLPGVKLWLEVGGSNAFEAAATSGTPPPAQQHAADDMLFIYTGGTTGYPKGVMWDQHVIWSMLGGGAPDFGGAPVESLDAHLDNVRRGLGRRRMLVMPPLMHGSGFLMGIYTLACGGSVVTLPSPSFQPLEVIEACARHKPTNAVIVGDAFARPLLRALDNLGPGGNDISSLQMIISSGTMWSPEVKAGLLKHNPNMVLIDSLGSSESLGMGAAVQSAANAGAATRFMHDPDTIVVDDQLRPVAAGEIGRIARGGLLPRGYYKDAAKTAATFVSIDGKRYSMAGDHAVLEPDGTMTLMGRGNQCINTGGEKVFPEEVEETLKSHPAVEDALVFGVTDDKWGQAVTAVVEVNGPAEPHEIIGHVRRHLAAYKAPKALHILPKVPRAPNGKADYAAAKAMVAELAAA
jgi:fatty-acyl-CoA synthase